MRRTIYSALTICLLAVGCGEAGGRDANNGRPGGKADDPEATAGEGETAGPQAEGEHAEQVQLCEDLAERAREHTSSVRYESLREVEQERVDCLVDANDATITAIKAKLDEADAGALSGADNVFKAPRSTATLICNLLVEASDDALDKSAAVVHTACVAQAEYHIAKVIDAHVDLGGIPDMLKPARDAYPECYDAHDVASAAALDVTAEAEASEDLADCIDDAVKDQSQEIADRVVVNFPGRDMGRLLDEVKGYFNRVSTAGSDACDVVGAASTRAATPEVAIDVAACKVSSAILGGELVGSVLLDLAPAGSDSPSEDEGGDAGGETGSTGGSSGSTTF